MVLSSKSKDSDQVSVSNKAKTSALRRKRPTESFIGVRERKWGRWVSEIRIPHDQKRIWLGSYDTPEKAARAYDAAVYCLRGTEGVFNFPTEERPKFTEGLSSTEIKAVAARFASPNCMSLPRSTSGASPNCMSLPCSTSAASPNCMSLPCSTSIASPNYMSLPSSSFSFTTSMNSPGVPAKEDELQGTCKVSDLDFTADAVISGSGTFWNGSFLLEELFPVEPDSIWAMLDETEHLGDAELYM